MPADTKPIDLAGLRVLVNGFRGRFFWQEAHAVDRGIGNVADCVDFDEALVYVGGEDDTGDDLTRDEVYVIGDELEEHVGAPIATMLNAVRPLLDRIEALEAGLREALDLAEEGWAYATPYFRDKWESNERTDALRSLLPPEAPRAGEAADE